MSSRMISVLAAAAWAATCFCPARTSADTNDASPKVWANLLESLSSSRAYLFDDAGRAALDEINAEFRQAQSAEGEASRDQAVARREAAANKLVELLEHSPALVRVTIDKGRASVSGPDTVNLPGDVGALLLHIDAGGDGTHSTSARYDMTERRDPIALTIEPRAMTWAVVSLTNVPAGASALLIQLDQGKPRTIPLIVRVAAPEPARLSISIVSAETGKPVPAMVKLVWKVDGSDRTPSGVVDFSAQFDSLGRASHHRHATLPGRLNGHLWWCVPGPFDMPAPPGPWEIIIRHGVEHVPVFDTFTAESGRTVSRTYRVERWVNMPKLGWYSGDDHVHCRITSDADASRLLAWTQAEDIHVANILKMGDVCRTWFQQRGFGPAHRVQDGQSVLVPGQECPRTHSDGFGHTVSLNTTSMVRDVNRYWLYDWVADGVHAQGGLFGYAHAWIQHPYTRRGMSLSVSRHPVDFAEILQVAQLGTELYYDFLNLGFKLTATAGSDVPWQGTIGEVRTYAYIGDAPFSAEAWFDAVRRGRTFVTNGPMIDFRVDDAMPGDEINVTSSRQLRVRARAWGDPRRMVPTKLEIVRHGAVIEAAKSSDENNPELSLDAEVPAGHGFWIAARAEGSDGSLAHTTPVYVVREGLRFWKHDGLDSLLADRLANLDDVESLIAGAEKALGQGEADDKLRYRLMVGQAPQLRERIAHARAFFEQLGQTAEQERSEREE